MLRLLVLIAVVDLASPALSATASRYELSVSPILDKPQQTFPVLLGIVLDGYRDISAPGKPSPSTVFLKVLALVILSHATARALPRKRRSATGRRAQAPRAAAEISRMR